jgi:hypothetical protein
MGQRKILQFEVISPSSRAGGVFRFVCETVGLLFLLVGVVIMAPPTFGAIILIGVGTIIVIRRKAYSQLGPLIQGRLAVFIGAIFLVVGGAIAIHAIL